LRRWWPSSAPKCLPDEREAILDAHPENAHAKRARGSDLYLEKPVVIVDGRTPGGLFEREPIRLSDYYVAAGNERPQYYLRDEIASEWNVRAGGSNMMFKPAYRCAPLGVGVSGRWWGFREHERSITPIASKGDRRALSLSTDRQQAPSFTPTRHRHGRSRTETRSSKFSPGVTAASGPRYSTTSCASRRRR